MSNWDFLNKNRVRSPGNGVPINYCSDDSYGFNGMFRFVLDTHHVRCVTSDRLGWQHVSVSFEGEDKTPSWALMCKIKELFWEDEDVVVQYHPAKSQYVNFHKNCLHLWRPTNAVLPVPDSSFVGPKTASK